MDKQQIITLIKEYLQSHLQFALATFGDHPWIATMFYAADDDLNLYFVTDPASLHAAALTANPSVAAVIADSPQDPGSKKAGIQLYGEASQVVDDTLLKHGFGLWREVLKVTDPSYSEIGVKEGTLKYRLYQLKPKKIKFYNEALWDEGDAQTIEL